MQEVHLDPTPSETSTESIRTAAALPANMAEKRWYWQIALTVLVLVFFMGLIAFDLGYNHQFTTISNVVFPSISGIVMLHFTVKNRPKKAPYPPASQQQGSVAPPEPVYGTPQDHGIL